MRLLKIFPLFFLICQPGNSLYGNSAPESLYSSEARLKCLFSKISTKKTPEENLLVNDSIITELEQTLKLPDAFKYPFDSLKLLGKITSEDQKVRIFTWNLSSKTGPNQYFGFILHRINNDRTDVFRLVDCSSLIAQPETATLDPSHWFGCLIYGIIEKKINGETHYFFLGYDPQDIFITRKLIDVLWFDKENPVFGKPLFHYDKTLRFRIVFEYSAKVQMMLQWNANLNMIVFDHLVPSGSSHTGNFQFYGPDLSYDALKFEKDFWELTENIDVRNN